MLVECHTEQPGQELDLLFEFNLENLRVDQRHAHSPRSPRHSKEPRCGANIAAFCSDFWCSGNPIEQVLLRSGESELIVMRCIDLHSAHRFQYQLKYTLRQIEENNQTDNQWEYGTHDSKQWATTRLVAHYVGRHSLDTLLGLTPSEHIEHSPCKTKKTGSKKYKRFKTSNFA